jgi:hypothetical protein
MLGNGFDFYKIEEILEGEEAKCYYPSMLIFAKPKSENRRRKTELDGELNTNSASGWWCEWNKVVPPRPSAPTIRWNLAFFCIQSADIYYILLQWRKVARDSLSGS